MSTAPAAGPATSSVLTEAEWSTLQAQHELRVDQWTGGWRERKQQGNHHPIDDFLFTYYPTRPTRLRRWHPGIGVSLTGPGARQFLSHKGYVEDSTTGAVVLEPQVFRHRGEGAKWIENLLSRTVNRPAAFGCFGLHVWALVYGQGANEVRHEDYPLRLTPTQIADTVQSQGLRCTHVDAFRFFTDSARPLNPHQLTRDSQPEFEQGGCLHANMDLYKWASKLSPVINSDLVANCFELARDVRTLDMASAPYDLSGIGVLPVQVETVAGRAAFVQRQREFSDRASILRVELLQAVRAFLVVLEMPSTTCSTA